MPFGRDPIPMQPTMQPTRAQPARAPVPGYIDPPNIVPGSGQMDPALIEQLMEVMRRSRMGGQRSPGAVQSQMMNTMGRGPAVESQMMNTMGRAPGNRPVARQIGGRPSGVDPAALMEMMRGTMGGNPWQSQGLLPPAGKMVFKAGPNVERQAGSRPTHFASVQAGERPAYGTGTVGDGSLDRAPTYTTSYIDTPGGSMANPSPEMLAQRALSQGRVQPGILADQPDPWERPGPPVTTGPGGTGREHERAAARAERAAEINRPGTTEGIPMMSSGQQIALQQNGYVDIGGRRYVQMGRDVVYLGPTPGMD